jgi:RNA polymerase sigma-70 factor (ECF subfamily)
VDPPDEGDALLIRRIAHGDRQALTDLYLRHRQALFHYLLQFTSDDGVAEELLQDTLVAVWKNARSYKGDARVLAWLFGIARRRACKRLRRRELPQADLAELETVPAEDPEPEAALLASVTRAEIAAALAQLAPQHREALLLAFVHELSYAEIAAVLEVPLGTVKSRLNHAKRSLRAVLRAGEEAEQ